eukprot:473453_1
MSAKNPTDEKERDKTMQLGEWLQQWDLQQYQVLLQKNGIKKATDFRFIKTKQHFDKLVEKLGDEMSVMDTFKLEDAWLSIVPSPQKEQPKVHFLSDNANKILNTLMLRYKDLSNDIHIVQIACNEFTKLSVQCKKDINTYADEMIQCVEQKRKALLNHVDAIKNKQKFETILNKLQNMNVYCQTSKDKFQQIAVNGELTTKQKEDEMKKLLALNIDDIDEKKESNYNHYKFIGNRRQMPKKISAVFKKNKFQKSINSYFSVKYEEIEKAWTLKPDYRMTLQDGKYRIKSVNTSMCIDVKDKSNSKGGMLHQWGDHAGSNQRFYLKQQSSGYYTVKCVNSGLYWKIKDGKLIQDSETGGDDQLFGFFQVEAKKFCIVTKNKNQSYKSLHVPDTTKIIEHDTNYSIEQLFCCDMK